jgi:hypothetical protein
VVSGAPITREGPMIARTICRQHTFSSIIAFGGALAGTRLLLTGLGLSFYFRDLSIQFFDRQFKRGDLTSGIRKIAISGGNPIPSFTVQFDQRPLKKLDIRLQACGTTLHLLLGRANFHPANVLPGSGRERYYEQDSRMEQKLPRSGPTPAKLWLLRFHWPEIIR